MYCHTVRRCFFRGFRMFCYDTRECVPTYPPVPFPPIGPYPTGRPIGPGTFYTEMPMGYSESCWDSCMRRTGGNTDRCQIECLPIHI
jgi:hypothetical protein